MTRTPSNALHIFFVGQWKQGNLNIPCEPNQAIRVPTGTIESPFFKYFSVFGRVRVTQRSKGCVLGDIAVSVLSAEMRLSGTNSDGL